MRSGDRAQSLFFAGFVQGEPMLKLIETGLGIVLGIVVDELDGPIELLEKSRVCPNVPAQYLFELGTQIPQRRKVERLFLYEVRLEGIS